MRKLVLGLTSILTLLVAGCAGGIDTEQLDLCRKTLPALHAEGASLREIRFSPAPPNGIRIDYAATEEAGSGRTHFAVCRFAGARFDQNRLELTALDTDQGPLGDARLFYLKRFWLTPLATGIAADALPRVPQISLTAAYALQQMINALALASIYGLLATAYSLIYGLVGRINLAFGDIAVIGAYGAIAGVAAFVTFGFDHPVGGFALALATAAALSAVWSWGLGDKVVAPLHARFRQGQPILVATAAAAVTIQEFLRLFQGVRERWLPPLFSGPWSVARAESFIVTVSPVQIYVAASAFAAAFLLLWVMARTRLGRQWRAFADDPVAAGMFGVSPARILGATFIIAGLNAGLAGGIVAVYYGNVSSSMGTMLGLKALLAAIVGGIGRIEGALIGGILIGLIEATWSAYFDIGSRDIVVFSLLIVMFILRPGGLLGFSGPNPREV